MYRLPVQCDDCKIELEPMENVLCTRCAEMGALVKEIMSDESD